MIGDRLVGATGSALSRRCVAGRLAGAAVALAATGLRPPGAQAARVAVRPSADASQKGTAMTAKNETMPAAPTVLLVHGAFADGSSWAGVIERLQAAGVSVQAPVNPLRGLSSDAAYVASVIAQTPGPVLAVGHSYGGAVITNAATGAPNVVGLVIVAGFAPAEGEVLQDVEGDSRDSVLNTALLQTTYPTGQGGETAVELT